MEGKQGAGWGWGGGGVGGWRRGAARLEQSEGEGELRKQRVARCHKQGPIASRWNLDFSLTLLGNHQKVFIKEGTKSHLHFKQIIHKCRVMPTVSLQVYRSQIQSHLSEDSRWKSQRHGKETQFILVDYLQFLPYANF